MPVLLYRHSILPLSPTSRFFDGEFSRGEYHGFVTPESVRQLEQRLKELGKSAEIHIYPEVDHGFFNDQRPTVYNEAAAKDAWGRVLKFYGEHLK